MDNTTEDNGAEKQAKEEVPYYKEWLDKTSDGDEQLPLERAVVQKLSEMVMEDESGKWDAIKVVADGFNKLGDDLEKLSENFFFQNDINDLGRKKAKENILRYLGNFRGVVKNANALLNEQSPMLGDLVIGLLKQPLEMLNERLDGIAQAAENEDSDLLEKEYKYFENYRNKFLNELVQVLGFVNDPFAKADSAPFEKEMTDNILNALKVPALPEGMFAKYSEQKNAPELKTDFFEKDYRFFMNIELKLHKDEIEEEIKAKRNELEEKKKQISYMEGSSMFETFMKEYKYWQEMTPKKRYKQLLRLRAFELLKQSAGSKRLTPEFMYKLYSEEKYLPQ